MTKRPKTSFYRTLLEMSDPILPALQEQIYRYLTAHRDFTLLGLLAQHESLTPEVDAKLRARNELAILIGWCNHPKRTPAELIERLRHEKRANALVRLAVLENLDESVYRSLSGIDSVKVSEALARNKSVPLDLRATEVNKAVERLTTARPEYRFSYEVGRLLGTDQPLLEEMCQRYDNMYVRIHALEQVKLSPGAIERIVNDVACYTLDGDDAVSTMVDLLKGLGRQRLNPDQRQLLAQAATRLKRKVSERHAKQHIADIAEMFTPRYNAFDEQIDKFLAAPSTEQADLLYESLFRSWKRPEDHEKIIDAASLSMMLSPSHLLKLGWDLTQEQETVMTPVWESRDELDALAELACETHWGEPWWLDKLKDPERILRHIIHYRRNNGADVPGWVYTHPLLNTSVDTALAVLPWSSISTVASELPGLHEQVQVRIVTALGDNPVHWETFDTLSDEFEGTLPELLETALAV
jgi:hypothetical protein